MIAYDNGNAYIFQGDAGANTAMVASEIELIAVVHEVTAGSLVAADFTV